MKEQDFIYGINLMPGGEDNEDTVDPDIDETPNEIG